MCKMNAKLAKNVSRLSSFVRVYVRSIGHGRLLMQGQTVMMLMGGAQRDGSEGGDAAAQKSRQNTKTGM